MAESIQWNSLTWSEGDDFLHFAFGAFNSKSFSSGGTIYRTSDSNRYNIHLAPPMQDITAEVPGGDGQYYFGTYHKPKVIDVSFAFEGLTKNEIQGLKRAFTGKELKELAFSEDVTYEEGNVNDFRIYTAKVTG